MREEAERNRIVALSTAAAILEPRTLEMEAFFRCLDRDDKILFLEMRRAYAQTNTAPKTSCTSIR